MPTAVLSVEREIIKGIVDIARHKEFYGHVIQQLERVFVGDEHSVQTAAVGRVAGDRFIKMYLSRKFFNNLFEEHGKAKGWIYMLGVLEHELVHCFPAGTMVGGSFLPIEKMVKGNKIIGSDGCGHKAERVEARDYSGGLVTIKPTGVIGFDVTDNHKILVADIPVEWKSRSKEHPNGTNHRVIKRVAWKNSQDVKVGDWLVVPRLKGKRSDVEIDISGYMMGNKWSVPAILQGGRISLNEDTAWLMGYYCAEGSSGFGGSVTFSMHDKERETNGLKVGRIADEHMGVKCHFRKHKGKASSVIFKSHILARMLSDKVGRGASNKRVPDEIFWHKDDLIVRAFLRGYFDGDGATESKKFATTTVSRVLAYQVQALCVRLGFWMNMHFDELSKNSAKVINGNKPSKLKDQYSLYSHGDDVRSVMGYDLLRIKGRPTRQHIVTKDFIYIRVRKVSRREWSGKVYNLRSPTRDYLVNNVVVHNCVFGHLFLKFQDKTRGAVAVDLVVNSIIPNDVLPGNYVTPEMYGFERGKSSMWYYTHLQSNKTYQKQCAEGQFGVGGVLSHILSSWDMTSDLKEDLVAKEFAKDIIRKAKELCNKNYGNIPGEVLAQIDNLLKKEKAIVPWAKVLRMFVASCAESILDYTVKRISRRFCTRPGTRKGDVLRVAVAVDTSGSISDELLKIFFNEIRWIWKNGVIVTIYEADCAVCSVYPFKGKFNGKVHGRGGTDLEPVLKAVEKERFDALIYFTDFYAPSIEKRYKVPTLWVLHTEMEQSAYPVKWGRHIRIEDGKAVAA